MGSQASSLGGFLGIGPDGPTSTPTISNPELTQFNERQQIYTDPRFADTYQGALSGLMGGGSNEQSLNRVGVNSNLSPAEQSEAQNELVSGVGGSRFATNEVQSSPILGQLFGQGGELSQSINKEQELQNQGFKLQPQDIEAYGQAGGNIARMFGQSEQGLSQNLADRGIAAAPSGAAGAGFSGLQGNKNEMLAQAQMDIANQRMQNTMGRIGQQQSFINQLGGQAENAIQGQYGRQMTGVQSQRDNLMRGAGTQTQFQDASNKANLAGNEFAQKNKTSNIMDMATGDTQIAGASFGKGLGSAGGAVMGG